MDQWSSFYGGVGTASSSVASTSKVPLAASQSKEDHYDPSAYEAAFEGAESATLDPSFSATGPSWVILM